jgi:hypothetical protein
MNLRSVPVAFTTSVRKFWLRLIAWVKRWPTTDEYK